MKSTRDVAAKFVDSFMNPKMKVEKSFDCGRVSLLFLKNGSCAYSLDKKVIHIFGSEAKTSDKRRITTADAKRTRLECIKKEAVTQITASYISDDLVLRQNFKISENDPFFTLSITLSGEKEEIKTNYLAPLAFVYPTSECDSLFRSLSQKMLIVPYDNDMWVRYENAPLSPGRTSYDVTAINDGERGLVIGALDFSVWKNAIKCSSYDARVYTVFSGVADPSTHDSFAHAAVCGKEVSSAEFFCGFYEDIRDGLEEYGDCVKENNPIKEWSHGVPFGWNSYSALMASLTTNHIDETADFMFNELPSFKGEDGSQYINLDASFGLSKKKLRKIIDKCHSRGQKVGTYIAPLITIPAMSFLPLKGSKLKRKEITLRKPDGSEYHTVDGSLPVDITIPEAETDLRLTLRSIAEDGYDYLKIDFLSHGALEGIRYDKSIKTGRQALMRFYEILWDELSPERIGREIFISLSIAPLFPSGFGHARRCCCDAFGHKEDSDYVLSSLRHAFWVSGRLYKYCDPDHTVLCNSVVDKRGFTNEKEAKLRYYSSVISGTVMLLSDNYGPYGDKEIISLSRSRAKEFADNEEINRIARLGKPFRPLYIGEDCNIFYLENKDRTYIALFNFASEETTFVIPKNKIRRAEDITRSVEPLDAVIFEV